MGDVRVKPAAGPINATVRVPGSKSLTNRALLAAALADGKSVIRGLLLADDTQRMIDALRQMGIRIELEHDGDRAIVHGCSGHIKEIDTEIFCGNAGTVMRFCTALAAVSQGRHRLDGVPRMRQRPIGKLVDALRSLGAQIVYEGEEGYPPLTVIGRGLQGGHVTLDSPGSSQFISALLLVGAYARSDMFLALEGRIPSQPYLEMTAGVMERFGVSCLSQDGRRFIIAAPQRYRGTEYAVEPDASSASYFLAAAAVTGGCVTTEGIGSDSVQGDAEFARVLERMGCRANYTAEAITVEGPKPSLPSQALTGIKIDMGAMPDIVQTLAVTAMFAKGATTISNIANLRIKETDRLAALAAELKKFGAKVELDDDWLTIRPPDRLRPAAVDTYEDHRMAMSFAVAGLVLDGVVIRNGECVSKTYPSFFEDFRNLAAPAPP